MYALLCAIRMPMQKSTGTGGVMRDTHVKAKSTGTGGDEERHLPATTAGRKIVELNSSCKVKAGK